MSQYFIDKLVYNNDTLDIHDTEAREMINTNTTNIQAVSARVTKNANDINTLKDTTNVIREDLDNVEDRVSVTEAEIDGLKTRTTSLEGKMVTAENRLDGHDTKISDLENRMGTAENNITALDGRMTTAENDIDAAEHRLDLVEAKNDEQDIAIDTLEANVSKNTADIVDIKDDLTGIHKDIGDLDDRITASTYEAGIGIYFGQGTEHTNINVDDEILNQINQNTIDIQNLKTRVTNVESRLTVVEGDITNIKGDIVNIKGEITDIKADIANIKADIVTIKGDITNIKADIVTIKADITSLETRVTNLETTVNLLEDESIYKYYDSSNISEFPISEYTNPVIDRKFVINEVPAGSWGYASALVPFTTADRWECWIECYKRPGATMTSTPVSRIRYARVSAVTHPSPYMSNHINMLFRKIDSGTWEVVEGELYLGQVTVPSTSGSTIRYAPPSAAEIAFNTAFQSANNIQAKSFVNTRVDVRTTFNNNTTTWNVLRGSGKTLMGFAAYDENGVHRNCCVAVSYNWDTPANTYVSVTDI